MITARKYAIYRTMTCCFGKTSTAAHHSCDSLLLTSTPITWDTPGVIYHPTATYMDVCKNTIATLWFMQERHVSRINCRFWTTSISVARRNTYGAWGRRMRFSLKSSNIHENTKYYVTLIFLATYLLWSSLNILW